MKEIKNGVLLFVALSLLTGVLYPAAVTVLAQVMFPQQANGSIMYMSRWYANRVVVDRPAFFRAEILLAETFCDGGFPLQRPGFGRVKSGPYE